MRKAVHMCLIVGMAVLLVFMTGCGMVYPGVEWEYYSDQNNFITESAVVDDIIHNEERGYIVLCLSEIDERYQRPEFRIYEDNYTIVKENGILDKIAVGNTVTFTSAPRLFGNGYMTPVVALSCGEDELLSFEEGYENLMEEYVFFHIVRSLF